VDLPTYTNIWRIEKRLYKLYDFRLPMPLPINWIAVFAGITVPYIVFLVAIGVPFNHTLVWLYVLPPGLLTWLTTRPVIENKRLPELVESQVRYLAEPRVWTRLAPHNEKDQMVVTARVWHLSQAPQRRKTAKTKATAGTVALRERNALARRGVAAPAIGDPAEGNAPLAATSALAAAPAAGANSRSRARARGTGPRIPAPGSSGRQRPPGRRTRPPQQDWAEQQREAARQEEFPEENWPAGQSPRVETTGTEDQAAKPGRFRLSALRPKPAGQAPSLPPAVAFRLPSEPRRPRFGSPPPSDQAGSARPWPEGPARPGQAAPPAWRMPAIRSAPPLGSVAAPMPSDLPAHAAPDVYPAPPAPDVEPTISAHAAPDADEAPPVHTAQDIDLNATPHAAPDVEPATSEPSWVPLGLASPEVAPDTPPVALNGDSATSVHAAPEVDPAAEAAATPDVEPAASTPASSELDAAPSVPGTPEADPDAPTPVALDGNAVPSVHVTPAVDPAAQIPEVEPAISAPASSEAHAAPSAPAASEVEPGAAAPGLGDVRSTPAPASPAAAQHVEISHDGPAQRLVPPAPVPPVNPALAWPSAEAEAAEEVVHEAVETPQAPVVKAVTDAVPPAVPSIERALSGPSKDRNLTWHGKVKIVAGTGQGPGKRDQEALDRARARLPLKTPQRVLVLGCTSGAGQSVTTLMTGHILASLREEPVAAVDLHDGTLAHYSAPAGWLEDLLSGRPPQGAMKTRPDGLGPTPKTGPARLDVIASRNPLRDGDELRLAGQLTRHYSLTMLDPGAAGLMRLLKIADQLVIVVPASIDGAGALADTRDWLGTHGFAELADHSVTVINGVSRRSLSDVEQAESVARGRCRAIVRVPWDDMLPVEVADPSALRPQTRVAYTALAGVLVAGLAAAPVRTSR
jgi:TcpE family